MTGGKLERLEIQEAGTGAGNTEDGTITKGSNAKMTVYDKKITYRLENTELPASFFLKHTISRRRTRALIIDR